MWFKGTRRTIGIRSRDVSELKRWEEVPYPDDRVRTHEYNRIEDYTIVTGIKFEDDGSAEVRLYGAIEKERFIPILNETYRKLSPNQQEYFRPVSLRHFDYELMTKLLETADKT